MFSQLFVLTARGDALIFRDYRGDLEQKCTEIFYNNIKTSRGNQAPCFNINGVNYIFVHTADLYFVLTTKKNVSPNCGLEFLQRFTSICKDYCGVLNENSIQQNFVLIYEILDEVLNFGYIQETYSQAIKPYVLNQPTIVEPYDKPSQFPGRAVFGLEKLRVGSDAANRPVGHSDRFSTPKKGEIFSDILEHLLVQVDSEGNVQCSELIGSITLRSFLPEGCVLTMALSDELCFGLQLEDYNLHPSVNSEEFESSGKLSVMPLVGEFAMMNYRMSGTILERNLPFTVEMMFEDSCSSKSIDVSLRINCNIPTDKYADKVLVQFNVPKDTRSVSCSGQTVEFVEDKNLVTWHIAQFQGGTTIRALFKLNGSFDEDFQSRRELDAINIRFEIPLFLCSGARVKSLRISGGAAKIEHTTKWARQITYSDSYVIRV
ncbi:AP-4 complex subunit mu-like isoform X2 [Dendronephthya gigantea]|uniref:AP-4 complex subunit mu-like isoform X2 n=1 Tax=Dendronephthya gigantea TaxID=151771 RepID=UPI00106CC8F7|nr:AP-4 complex subunit mu-like isoform X2 [Dendronephthya gigantea]